LDPGETVVPLTSANEPAAGQPPTPGDRVASDSIARNTAFATLSAALTASLAVVLTLYLVRALSPQGYGTYTLALAIGALVALPMDFGISSSAGRFIAERRGDRQAIAAYIADALRLKVAICAALGLTLFLAAGGIADLYGTPNLTWPLRGVALALVGGSLTQLFAAALIAQGRLPVGVLMMLSQSVGFLVASVVLISLGAGATGAAFGRATGYALGVVTGAVLIARLFGRSALAIRTTRGHTRQIAMYAGALALVEGAYLFFDQLDALLIGAFLTETSVGLFQAPFGLTVFMHYPAGVVATTIAPRVARHLESGSDVRSFRRALRYLIVGYGLLLAPLIVWAGPIVHLLLGSDYGESANVLRAFAPYVFLAAVGALLSPAANYLGQARKRLPVALAAVAINLAVDVIFIPRIGIVAGAIGTDLALAVYVPAHLWICAQVVDIPLRPLGVSLVRSLVAAAVMAGVLLLFGTEHLSVTAWLVGGVGGVLAYVAVMLVSRELSVAELRLGATALRRRLG
jgi:O-antigen/teichoic acid export membrane protein